MRKREKVKSKRENNSFILSIILVFLSFFMMIINVNADEDAAHAVTEEILEFNFNEIFTEIIEEYQKESLNKNYFRWATHGSLFYFAANNGRDSDPAPILPSVGISAGWRLWRPLWLELTEDIYFQNYEYNPDLGHAMACNPENRSAFVMGFLTGLQLTGKIRTGGKESERVVRVYAGPTVDLRIVTLALGLNHPDDFTGNIDTDAQMQTDAIRKYFWSDGRFLFISTGFGMDFPLNERFLLGFDLRTLLPVYRFWTDKNLPGIDGYRFGAGIRITPRR